MRIQIDTILKTITVESATFDSINNLELAIKAMGMDPKEFTISNNIVLDHSYIPGNQPYPNYNTPNYNTIPNPNYNILPEIMC